MSENGKFQYSKILDALDKADLLAKRAIMILVVFTLVMTILSPTGTAFGQDGDPPMEEAASNLVGIFTDLGKLAIKVIYGLILIVFAVGTVKSGLGAQAAQAFGATSRVSLEMMNLVGGILIFGIALMTLPLANMIIDTVTKKLFEDGFSVDIHNPFAP